MKKKVMLVTALLCCRILGGDFATEKQVVKLPILQQAAGALAAEQSPRTRRLSRTDSLRIQARNSFDKLERDGEKRINSPVHSAENSPRTPRDIRKSSSGVSGDGE